MAIERCDGCRFSRIRGVGQGYGESFAAWKARMGVSWETVGTERICSESPIGSLGYWPAVGEDDWCGRYQEGPQARHLRAIAQLERDLPVARMTSPGMVPAIEQQIAALKSEIEIGDRVPA